MAHDLFMQYVIDHVYSPGRQQKSKKIKDRHRIGKKIYIQLEPINSIQKTQKLNCSHAQTVQTLTRRMTIANGTCVSFCTFWPPLGTPLGQSR